MAEQIESNSAPELGTDCAECIFFCNIEDESNSEIEFSSQATQNCKLGKISKFEKSGARFENRDGKFLVNRVCSFRRTEEWQKDKSIEECVDEVQKTVTICGSIVLNTKTIKELDKCISKLSQIKHIENFKIIVAHYSDLPLKEVFDYIQSQDHFKELTAVQVNDAEFHAGQVHFLDEALKRAKNGFIFTIDCAKELDENILDKVNHYVYHEMEKLLYIPANEKINASVVMGVLYKYLKGNKFWAFSEKLEAVAKNQGIESQILSWDAINEKYID